MTSIIKDALCGMSAYWKSNMRICVTLENNICVTTIITKIIVFSALVYFRRIEKRFYCIIQLLSKEKEILKWNKTHLWLILFLHHHLRTILLSHHHLKTTLLYLHHNLHDLIWEWNNGDFVRSQQTAPLL